MIYDCIMLHDEIDMLEFRLKTLGDAVDYFVIAEADRTFSNQPKPLYLQELPEKLAPYADQIIYIPVTDMPANPNAWVRETHQRNAVIKGLSAASPNDLILLSDVDEIPDMDVVEANMSNDDICGLRQRFYYYFFNLRKGVTSAASASLFKNLNVTPHEARVINGRTMIDEAGWHFSYLMQPNQIADKIRAFSHQEFNTSKFVSEAAIREAIEGKKDLFGRKNTALLVEDLTQGFPKVLLDNQEKYADFILPAEGHEK